MTAKCRVRLIFISLLVLAVSIVLPANATAFAGPDWEWLNPLPQGKALSDVDFVDDSTGWAVGGNGAVLMTSDGGATWQTQEADTPLDLHAVDFVSDQSGWIVGDCATILHTSDGGATWQQQAWRSGQHLDDVCFLDAQRGWAVGESGTVLRTSDAGATWDPVGDIPSFWSDGGRVMLTSIAFRNTDEGWAVGNSDPWYQGDPQPTIALVFHTTDGGLTWARQWSAKGPRVEAVALSPAGNTVLAVGTRNTVLRSTDAGDTWQQATAKASVQLNDVAFGDDQHAWAVADSTYREDPVTVIASSDGGASWHSQPAPPQPSDPGRALNAVTFTSATRGWAGGEGGDILCTTDGGTSWQAVSAGVDCTADFMSLDFASPQEGWGLAGWWWSPTRLLHTTDGGASWSLPSGMSTAKRYSAVCALPGGFAVTVAGRSVWRTTDAGVTWTKIRTLPRGSIYVDGLEFVDSLSGWILVNEDWGDTRLLRTSDGGATWKVKRLPPWSMSGISFVDVLHGWALGNPAVRRTTDGGATWQTARKGNASDYSEIDFATASDGWADTPAGLIHTSDSGETWSVVDIPFDNVQDIEATSTSNVALLTQDYLDEASVVLRSTDGGAHWGSCDTGAGEIDDLEYFDAQNGWLGGSAVGLLHTTTGGGLAPATQATLPDDYWWTSAAPVTAELAPWDDGLGLALTQYRLDDGPWQTGTTAVVPAPADHSGDGWHALCYRSIDLSGGAERIRWRQIGIDTTGPATLAPRAAAVRRGEVARLRFRIDDVMSMGSGPVTIRVKTRAGRTVRILHSWAMFVGQINSAAFRCKLPRGRYEFFIYAKDQVGNRQTSVGHNVLRVM